MERNKLPSGAQADASATKEQGRRARPALTHATTAPHGLTSRRPSIGSLFGSMGRAEKKCPNRSPLIDMRDQEPNRRRAPDRECRCGGLSGSIDRQISVDPLSNVFQISVRPCGFRPRACGESPAFKGALSVFRYNDTPNRVPYLLIRLWSNDVNQNTPANRSATSASLFPLVRSGAIALQTSILGSLTS